MKSQDFAGKNNEKTLLVFYKSDCGNCEALLEELKESYKIFNGKSVRIISLSGDSKENIFKEKSKSFPWKDAYYESKGMEGINFKNYGVVGTPTVFLIDRNGK